MSAPTDKTIDDVMNGVSRFYNLESDPISLKEAKKMLYELFDSAVDKAVREESENIYTEIKGYALSHNLDDVISLSDLIKYIDWLRDTLHPQDEEGGMK